MAPEPLHLPTSPPVAPVVDPLAQLDKLSEAVKADPASGPLGDLRAYDAGYQAARSDFEIPLWRTAATLATIAYAVIATILLAVW